MARTSEPTGWGKPEDSARFHFFARSHGDDLLESVCTHYTHVPWFWSRAESLESVRDLHMDENCYGCRAWLSIPRNRLKIGVSVSL